MEEELDLTNAHLADDALKQIAFPETLKVLDLTANRIQHVDERILGLADLSSLSFRQNLLQDVAALGKLQSASGLRHLILHDNQLTQLPPLSRLTACEQLEVSYNSIRSIEGLRDLPTASLKQFYAACNKVQTIQGLDRLTGLKVLELGGNRIREIQGLENLQQLEELWLGRNRLEAVSNLDRLVSLKQLSVQSNRLKSLGGLEECQALEELYVSHNGIESLRGIERLTSLKVLDASNNQLKRADGLHALEKLQDLWLNDNQIEDAEVLRGDLEGQASSLTCLYLSANPIVKELGSQYKPWLKGILPKLEQIDADLVR